MQILQNYLLYSFNIYKTNSRPKYERNSYITQQAINIQISDQNLDLDILSWYLPKSNPYATMQS